MKIIAEIGQNFNGDIDLALKMIESVRENGADIAKFQLYDAKNFSKENNPWYEYNCKTELSRKDLEVLAGHCEKLDVEFMCYAFDMIVFNGWKMWG